MESQASEVMRSGMGILISAVSCASGGHELRAETIDAAWHEQTMHRSLL